MCQTFVSRQNRVCQCLTSRLNFAFYGSVRDFSHNNSVVEKNCLCDGSAPLYLLVSAATHCDLQNNIMSLGLATAKRILCRQTLFVSSIYAFVMIKAWRVSALLPLAALPPHQALSRRHGRTFHCSRIRGHRQNHPRLHKGRPCVERITSSSGVSPSPLTLQISKDSDVAKPTKSTKRRRKRPDDLGIEKEKKKRTPRKRKSKTETIQHWTNASDLFALVLDTTTGPRVADGGLLLNAPKSHDLADQQNRESKAMSLALTIRGNPLPLRRHRTSRGFVYNPSANAQSSFRNATSVLVFGVPADEAIMTKDSSCAPPLFSSEAFLSVTLILRLKRPLSHFRASKRESGVLKASAPPSLTSVTRTDADNLAKFVLDACNGLLYDDDRQIQSLHVIKQLDNEGECLGSTQLLIRAIDDSMEENIIRHAMQPYIAEEDSEK